MCGPVITAEAHGTTNTTELSGIVEALQFLILLESVPWSSRAFFYSGAPLMYALGPFAWPEQAAKYSYTYNPESL